VDERWKEKKQNKEWNRENKNKGIGNKKAQHTLAWPEHIF